MARRPRPSPDSSSFSRDRRKLLVAGGFGAASLLLLRDVPGPSDRSGGGTTTTTVTVREPAGPPSIADAPAQPPDDHTYELVISGGRVIDPETGFDEVADVGVDGETIAAISEAPLTGRSSIDASGLVVAPGFIDILSYEPNEYGIWFKVADGVTTNLGMHGINARAADFFARYEGRTPCHFGGAFDNPYMRNELVGLSIADAALPAQIDQMEQAADTGFDQGWIGLDFEPEYTPGIETNEMIELGRIAAEHSVPIFFHVRYSDPERNADAIAEVLRVARETGAAVHVDHITSTGGTFTMEQTLATIEEARVEGLDVTADLYPYEFWATTLGAARFDPSPDGTPAVERFRIDYADLQLVGTSQRLSEATFEQMRRNGENPLVAALDSIPEEDIRAALRADFTMIGSDAILQEGDRNHPRSTGCFARTLGVYVRDRQVLPLTDALAKMTILPARRLETAAPAMRRKGRLQRGADADITIFDADRIADRGTIEDPDRESVGIEHVLVLGQPVKDPEGLRRDVLPGRPIGPATT